MGSEARAKKRSAFSCESCRQRKVKCSGKQPRCATCIARNVRCEYKLLPTRSYTQRLEARIEHLERVLTDSGISVPNKSLERPWTRQKLELNDHEDGGEAQLDHPIETMNLGSKDDIAFASTACFFSPVSMDFLPASDGRGSFPLEGHLRRRERLKQNAWNQKSVQILSDTPEPFQYMINDHWCWIQPLFNFVYRPAFTRDVQMLGPYHSHPLLNALLAHSAHWCRKDPHIRALLQPFDEGAMFHQHARTSLFEELSEGKCTVTTIQTLLLLSALECGAGHRTQVWLYSGMAFRLLEDLGICVGAQNHPGCRELSDEDMEIRNRLFWSCYFWDKMISLYLGRPPSLEHNPKSPPQVILDDSAEDEDWVPHGLVYPPGKEYPPTKARSTSCFIQICRLSVIFNQILRHMYNADAGVSDEEKLSCFYHQGAELQTYWDELPEFLRIEPTRLPLYAPPSHIVTLNCLFHAFKILLHRPMLLRHLGGKQDSGLTATCLKECLISANSIVMIFNLFRQTFGEGRIILSLAYCLYTAASIFLMKIQVDRNPEPNVLDRMSFCLSALARIKQNTPVIDNALNIIRGNLRKAGIDPDTILPLTSPESYPSFDGIGDGLSHSSSWPSGGINYQPQLNSLDDWDCSYMNVDSETLDAFASLEPISVQVGVNYPVFSQA